jgi:hypothetical protein
MKLVTLGQKQPDPALVAELRDLLAMAESGELEYIAYVAIAQTFATQNEAGMRDAYQIHGRLHELAADILRTEADE